MSNSTDTNAPVNPCSTPETVRGKLIVVSSPSGGGKGTLIRRALKIVPDIGYSVSFTTRPPREGETNGVQYFFVSQDEFQQMVREGGFLEWAVVHGNLYGTACAQVERELEAGRDILLEIDVQGAEIVRRLAPDAVTIFILPPSFEVLTQRLIARGSEGPDALSLRLKNARREVEDFRYFDFVVINDDADRAAAELASIISAERSRRIRQEKAAAKVLQSFLQAEEKAAVRKVEPGQ